MAFATTHTYDHTSFRARISALGAATMAWIERIQAARIAPYARRIERLHAMNDAELARVGIKRDEIELHVMRDLFYA